jgi:hypothetical protein
MKKLIFILLIVFYTALNYLAQVSGSLSLIATPNSKPDWICFKNPALVDPSTIFLSYGGYMGLSGDDAMVLLKQETDDLGITHTYYEQNYKNFKVEGCQFIIHSRNSKSYLANGNICKNLNVNINATISPSIAIAYAMSHVNATTYMWQDSLEENNLKQRTNNVNATYYPNPELLITMNGVDLPVNSSNYKLAYKIEIIAKVPFVKKTVYIDANDGSLIKEKEVGFSCTPANNSHTLFSGLQTLTTNYIYNSSSGLMEYQLHNPCKGGGVLTNHNSLGSAGFVFDTDNIWGTSNSDKSMSQVHWATEKYYDFLLSTFNRHSINGSDVMLTNLVNDLGNLGMQANAEYASNTVTYYRGCCGVGYGFSFCSNDIIGHEWGHGVTDHAVVGGDMDLGEARSINEGLGDVFGTTFEYYLEGAGYDWTIAEDFHTLGGNPGLVERNLADPMSKGMPDTYMGVNYATSNNHAQGQIVGYWFYLMSVGSGGVKQNHPISPTPPESYNINGLGIMDAVKILYRAYNYLTPTSNYHDLRRATIQAGIDIYGSGCSMQVNQIIQAWDAVRVFDYNSECGTLTVCVEKTINCNPLSATLNAIASGGSGQYSYTWLDINATTVYNVGNSPTAYNVPPGSYFCIIGDDLNGGCQLFSQPIVIEPLEVNPFVITVTANKNPICLGECVTITATGASNYTFDNVSNASNSIQVCPTVNTTYVVKGTGFDGCTSDTKSINIIVNQPISVSVSTPYLCPGQSAVVNAAGANTYAISPTGFSTVINPFVITPSSSQTFNITGTDNAGCVTSKSIDLTVDPIFCCSQGNAFVATSGTIFGGGVYHLNSTLTLTNDLNLFNLTIFMGVNAEIIIPNNVKLNLSRVHILGCPSMWKGIKCAGNSASVFISNSTLIEDAITAVDLKNVVSPKTGQSYILSVNASTFNKNLTSVNIENYNIGSNYPSLINASVFTCRKLITSDHTTYLGAGPTTYNWNAANANTILRNSLYNPGNPVVMALGIGVNVTDQFSASTYPSINLSYPNQNIIGRQGILLNNVAYGDGSSIPFKGFVIGNTGTNYSSINVFDNMNFGINSINSNVSSYNAAYQNMIQYLSNDPSGFSFYTGGAGIKSETNSKTVVNKLNVLPSSGSNFDKNGNFFFNNSYGILATNLQYSDIQFAMFHSNRVYVPNLVSNLSVPQGEYGIYILTNSYPSIKVDNNYLTNINTGISFYSNGVSLEQAYGSVSISSNYLQSDYTGNPTNRSMGQAIVADNLFNCKECIANDDIFGINVNGNQIKNVFRGIKSSNWKQKFSYAANNTIILTQEPNNFLNKPTTQYGILHENNNKDLINSNTITGFGISKATTYAIRVRDNVGQTMLCNSTASTYEGFSFSGSQNIVKWLKNNMQSHVRGMHLNNTTIGQQGNVGQPMDNLWQVQGNGWSGSNFQTYVTTSNIATNANNSKLYVRNIATLYRPTNNSALNFLTEYSYPTSIITTSGNSPIQCPTLNNPGGGGSSGLILANTITSEVKRALNQIIKDSVIYSEFIPNKKIIGKQAVYNFIKQNQSVLTNEVDLQNFYNQTAISNVNSLLEVENNLSKASFTLAESTNSNISPSNNIETNTKYFYDLFVKYTKGKLVLTDKASLFNLANGCPDRDGAVVYQARVLYNSINNIYHHFEDSCITSAANNNRIASNINADAFVTEVYNSLQIYPNPNNGRSLINFRESNITNMQLKVYDVNGRVIYEDKVNDVTDKFYELNLSVKSGIYFVEIYDEITEVRYKQKLVIE